ncbi:MAG: hypothetical protein EBU81_13485 [Proteobacteria bacterium]|nr:hypothetical protein [Pseudomonadota bacterium]
MRLPAPRPRSSPRTGSIAVTSWIRPVGAWRCWPAAGWPDPLVSRLKLLSPQNVLDRGYSLTFDADTGALVRQAQGLVPGRRLQTRLQSGEVSSVVTRVVEGGAVSEGSQPSPP